MCGIGLKVNKDATTTPVSLIAQKFHSIIDFGYAVSKNVSIPKNAKMKIHFIRSPNNKINNLKCNKRGYNFRIFFRE